MNIKYTKDLLNDENNLKSFSELSLNPTGANIFKYNQIKILIKKRKNKLKDNYIPLEVNILTDKVLEKFKTKYIYDMLVKEKYTESTCEKNGTP